MKCALTIINQYISKIFIKTSIKPNPVGRWNNDCIIKTNKKIDFSNEDHCGPCGVHLKNKTNEIEIFKD